MKWFNDAFLNFFIELSQNNNKQWFDLNRSIYEKEVKKPFVIFVQEMIQQMNRVDPSILIQPSDAIMRINNDIRFSADKTPYKLHVGANISARGKRDLAYPGLYFEFAADAVRLYGGSYMPEKEQLLSIRNRIANQPAAFHAAYSSPDFVQKFGELQGEKNKRLPAEFQSIFAIEPLIANKQFYYGAELPADTILRDDLTDVIMSYFHAGKPVNDFLRSAFH